MTLHFSFTYAVASLQKLSPPLNEELIDEHSSPKKLEGGSGEALENRANKGSLIIDATCAPSKVRYPTDTPLLNEVRAKSELIIDQLHEKGQQNFEPIERKRYSSLSKGIGQTATR